MLLVADFYPNTTHIIATPRESGSGKSQLRALGTCTRSLVFVIRAWISYDRFKFGVQFFCCCGFLYYLLFFPLFFLLISVLFALLFLKHALAILSLSLVVLGPEEHEFR